MARQPIYSLAVAYIKKVTVYAISSFFTFFFYKKSLFHYVDIVVLKSSFSGYRGYVAQFPSIEVSQNTPEEVIGELKEKLLKRSDKAQRRYKINSIVYKPKKTSSVPMLY